jgi:predicted TIM-barrel fold metal-dependent hydrolase
VMPSQQMWDYLEDAYQERRPIMTALREQPGRGVLDAAWLIDGRVIPHGVGRGVHYGGYPLEARQVAKQAFSLASQALSDPQARLRDLDQLGIDVSVIYPSTTFAYGVMTDDLGFEAALFRAHNTYMAEQCRQAPDRLKWAAVVPIRDVPAAIREAHRTRELGASAFVLYGTAGHRLLHEPQFDPFFAEAERLRLPIAIHIGPSFPAVQATADSHVAQLTVAMTLPLLMATYSVLCGGLLDRHPDLRFLFLEAGSEWIPFMVHRFEHYQSAAQAKGYPFSWQLSRQNALEALRSGRVYVSAEPDEELLPYVLDMIGEDHVVYASDMPHEECRENPARELLQRQDLSETARHKIVGANARRLYGG